MSKEKKIMFLCDRMKECCNDGSCGIMCFHTADPDHAKYPIHTNFLRDNFDPDLWWECETCKCEECETYE